MTLCLVEEEKILPVRKDLRNQAVTFELPIHYRLPQSSCLSDDELLHARHLNRASSPPQMLRHAQQREIQQTASARRSPAKGANARWDSAGTIAPVSRLFPDSFKFVRNKKLIGQVSPNEHCIGTVNCQPP